MRELLTNEEAAAVMKDGSWQDERIFQRLPAEFQELLSGITAAGIAADEASENVVEAMELSAFVTRYNQAGRGWWKRVGTYCGTFAVGAVIGATVGVIISTIIED